jgi:glutamine amidotransferase
MCRVLSYLGSSIHLQDLLHTPDSSLIKQCYDSRMLGMLNLAGFGYSAWDNRNGSTAGPMNYKTTTIPIFDQNLASAAAGTMSDCILAHIRGVMLSPDAQIGPQNLHPFTFRDTPIVFAHNGDLALFRVMRFDLLEFVKPEIARQISGSTDSEWMYAVYLSQLDDPSRQQSSEEMATAMAETLKILRKVRERNGIDISSSTNLFVADGRSLIASRFTFDYGCYGNSVHEANLSYLSLWFTFGSDYGFHDGEWKMTGGAESADSIIISSEPLTVETSTWLEVPEYSALCVTKDNGKLKANIIELDV